jgi:hypothetical protein
MTDPPSATVFSSASAGTWTVLEDAWHYDGAASGTIVAKLPIADADIWLGLDVDQVLGFPRQAAVDLVGTTVTPYYYADCYDAGGNPSFGISHFDGTNFQSYDPVVLPNGIHAGALLFHVVVRTAATGAAGFTSTLAWPAEPYATAAPTPGYSGQTQFVLATQHLAISVRWMAVVATTP